MTDPFIGDVGQCDIISPTSAMINTYMPVQRTINDRFIPGSQSSPGTCDLGCCAQTEHKQEEGWSAAIGAEPLGDQPPVLLGPSHWRLAGPRSSS